MNTPSKKFIQLYLWSFHKYQIHDEVTTWLYSGCFVAVVAVVIIVVMVLIFVAVRVDWGSYGQ